MKRIRPRVGLKMLLILMALSCVLAACYRAYRDLRHQRIREELIHLEDEQRDLQNMVKYNANVSPQRIAELAKIDAVVAEKKKAIGETDTNKK